MDSLPVVEIKYKDFPKFTNSKLINKELNNLFTLICNDFIARWFFLISEDQDEEFIEEIAKLIDALIKDIEIRLKKIDFIQLLLMDLPIVVEQYIKDFYNCKEKCDTIYSEGKSFEEMFHGVHAHFALDNPEKETEYLRRLMEIMIKTSLPEAERNLKPAVLMLREIMAKIVLENTVDSLAEPAFIYDCIIKIFEKKPETEVYSSTENITTNTINTTNEIITNYENDKELNSNYEIHRPNSFKRNTLNNNYNFNLPISFNNYNNKADENNYINNINTIDEDDDYDEYESFSDTEYSESIYKMIKLDKEEEEGYQKKILSKTPGAFPKSFEKDKGKLNTINETEVFNEENQEYLNYFDISYKLNNNHNNNNNEEDSFLKNMSTNYSDIPKLSHKNNHINNLSNLSENSVRVIQTEPPPTMYSTIISKLDFNNYKAMASRSIQHVYNNIADKLIMSYNKINSLLDYVRKPFFLFTVSSEKYNDYQLYKPFTDLVNLIFQFSYHNTWIWKKVSSLLDFMSYFQVGKLMNRSLIRGVEFILSEEKVAWYMNELSTSLWPDGHFIPSTPPPTAEETEISRNIAQTMMKESIPDSVKSLFGKGVIDEGFNRILEIFQNKTVNKHLIFTLIDMIFLNIYPEHYNQLSNLEPKYIQKPLNMNIQDVNKPNKPKIVVNTQLERELLTASNEPIITPKSETSEKNISQRTLRSRSSNTIEKLENKRTIGSSVSSPSILSANSVNSTGTGSSRRRLKRVSNYIKYMLNLKPLNQS